MSPYNPKGAYGGADTWLLEGFAFDRCPMTSNRLYCAVLTQGTFLPPNIPMRPLAQLRFRTNIRIIFEAVGHFLEFWNGENFWTRIRATLGYDQKTTEQHLRDIVLAYLRGRRSYLRNRGLAVRPTTRLEKLADKVNEHIDHGEREYTGFRGFISTRNWEEYMYKWETRLQQVSYDLGILEKQFASGDCAPELRRYAPAQSLASRISAPPSEGQSPGNRHHDAKIRRSRSPSPSQRKTETTSLSSTTHSLPQKPRVQSPERRIESSQPEFSTRVDLPSKPSRPSWPGDKYSAGSGSQEFTTTSVNNQGTNKHSGGTSASGTTSNPPVQAKGQGQESRKRSLSETVHEANVPRKRVATEPGPTARDAEQAGETTAVHEPARESDEKFKEFAGQQPSDERDLLKGEPPAVSDPTKTTSSKIEESGVAATHEPFKSASSTAVDKSAKTLAQKGSSIHDSGDESTLAIRELIISLETRQSHLEEMEASMRAWQEQFTKNLTSESQTRIQKLETRVQSLTTQLEQSEQQRVANMNLLVQTLESNNKRTSSQVEIWEKRTDLLANELANDSRTTKAKLSDLEAGVSAIKASGQTEQIIEMHADIMSLNVRMNEIPDPRQFNELKTHLHSLEGRVKAQITAWQVQHKTANDLTQNLEERHAELRTDVTKRTEEFESALKKLQSQDTNQTPGPDSVRKLRTEFEEFRNKHSKKSTAALKKRVDDLSHELGLAQRSITEQTDLLYRTQQDVLNLAIEVEKLDRERNNIPANVSQESLPASDNQSKLQVFSKRLGSIEEKVGSESGQDTIQAQLNELRSAIGALEEHLRENISVDRVQKLEAAVEEMKETLPETSSTDMNSVDMQLCQVRQYMDHGLEMTKAIVKKRLDDFQAQINKIPSVARADQLATPISPQHNAPFSFRDDQLVTLQRQIDEVREALRSKREDSISSRLSASSRPSSSVLSDLQSLIAQSHQPKAVLELALGILKTTKKGIRQSILSMDAAGEVDDDQKMRVTDVSFELDRIAKLAIKSIEALTE
ncbi:hypothetical protein PFICI_09955 [Pestalotiopsis fici W106-1]|uniref:Uncharacterized protein n=1 Tax=Pestalotiopsis fici (strain W106-1 / CGMCC3.15140) TaxID=1229662 RepID=W3WVJ4_PESFW|nr:uncharacterized protein PFICI_09955 [Pestalotiopsis fici W106-1]ETS77893.1 hypothetical protein PFICI_09955 [Pestalotiopsis fici W106-1]